jgi:hypothetical protein
MLSSRLEDLVGLTLPFPGDYQVRLTFSSEGTLEKATSWAQDGPFEQFIDDAIARQKSRRSDCEQP